MKIIIPQKITKIIYNQVKKHSPNETKGALFARRINDELFEIDAVYLEKKIGSFAFVVLENNSKYKEFQKKYNKTHHFDFKNHNYIGDWHSHPSFELIPSGYDIKEVQNDLEKSNANFLIQIIVKVSNDRLIGNAFLYDNNKSAEKIELIIESN